MADRLVTVQTVLKDKLRFRHMDGREAISEPFLYRLTLVGDEATVPLEKLLGSSATVEVPAHDGKTRHFNGLVADAAFAGHEGEDALFEVRLRPWLWFLSRTQDCRIFQNQTVVEILNTVFEKYPDAKLDAGRLAETYAKRLYTVQYRESDLDFTSRLMEEEGIAYFFTHESGRHTLVLADAPGAWRTVPAYEKVPYFPKGTDVTRERDHVDSWRATAFVQPGSFVHTSYDFTNPRADLMAKRAAPAAHELAEGEVYDYPGAHLALGEGERIARLRLEEIAARHSRAEGAGNAVGLTAGHRFELEGYPRADQNVEHLVVSLEPEVWDPSYRSGERAAERIEPYRCRFATMPAAKVFRPPLCTPRPVMRGPQTAVVTGPGGAEIHTDEHGRVKLQFHWDRLGKKDENSSCWVRVSQAWAGQGYGGMLIPRIGQEVIVDFLEGDPDRPIVTGRVYNGIQTPPYALPGASAQSGLKSNSTKGGGGSNEWMLDDTKGSERTYFHAQKDHDAVVEHDMTEHVKNDKTGTVDVDETLMVGGNRTRTVVGNETVTVQSNRTDTVQKNETRTVALVQQQTVGAARNVSVGASQTHEIGASDGWSVGAGNSWTIGADREVKIGKDDALEVGKNRSGKVAENDSLEVGKDQSAKIGKNLGVDVGEDYTIKVGKKLSIDAGEQIIIKTGSAAIAMKKDGTINIEGKDITVQASGKLNLKAGGNVTIKGQKIEQN